MTRQDVTALLTLEECITAVEGTFKLHAEGKTLSPKILGIHTNDGGFHIKAGVSALDKEYFVAKINANFPGNMAQHGLPTIQGIIAIFDGRNGQLLALMDSIEATIIRTGAATAVATKYLALPDAKTATICGCGNQGRISLIALLKIRSLQKVFAFDIDDQQSKRLADEFSNVVQVIPIRSKDLETALNQSDICVTCTPSRQPFIRAQFIRPGTFIAAVGADSEEKQELYPELLASSKIVVDLLEQTANIGELHHGIVAQKVKLGDVHAELGEIIACKKPGRESKEEIIIFDSTGTALQDVAAAIIVYEKAMAEGRGTQINFMERESGNLNALF